MTEQKKVLVIDDEQNIRATLAVILGSERITVNTASNGQEARHCFNNNSYNLVFLDLKMPDIDGMTLLKEIRSVDPEIPVIILTGHATLEFAIEAVRQGARDFLLKPADPAQLIARVNEILAEEDMPSRQKVIVNQIQNLFSELQNMDSAGFTPVNILSSVRAADSSRFLQLGPFTLDLHARHLLIRGEFTNTSPSNFDYLQTLIRHSPAPVSYQKLVKESQGYDLSRVEAQEMTRWRIHELRKAIEPDPKHPRFIQTVRGQGYRIVTDNSTK